MRGSRGSRALNRSHESSFLCHAWPDVHDLYMHNKKQPCALSCASSTNMYVHLYLSSWTSAAVTQLRSVLGRHLKINSRSYLNDIPHDTELLPNTYLQLRNKAASQSHFMEPGRQEAADWKITDQSRNEPDNMQLAVPHIQQRFIPEPLNHNTPIDALLIKGHKCIWTRCLKSQLSLSFCGQIIKPPSLNKYFWSKGNTWTGIPLGPDPGDNRMLSKHLLSGKWPYSERLLQIWRMLESWKLKQRKLQKKRRGRRNINLCRDWVCGWSH